MFKFILFLHLIGSVGMGIYLLLPFLVGRLGGKPGAGQAGFAGLLVTLNRIAQYMLIIQFLTGGYLIGKGSYPHVWSAVIVLIFLAIAAIGGIMGKPLKRLRDDAERGIHSEGDAGKVKTLGTVVGVLFLVMLFLMKYPELFV